MTVALLDGDIIAYKCAIISTDTFEDQSLFDPISVKRNIEIMVDEWAQLAKATARIVCISSEDHRYFRHTVYPDYKGNRKEKKKPAALKCAYDILKSDYKYEQRAGLEADDVMGILSGDPRLVNPIIVSIDKDMLTVPSKLLNPNKPRRPVKIIKAMADRQMLIQAMSGDSTDNYPGIEGIGPVKAEKLMAQFPTPSLAWRAVVEAFGSEKKALTMVRLARILRYGDYNDEKGEVRLWHPRKKDIWIKSIPPTIKKEKELKQSTTSYQSQKTSKVTKRSVSATSSSTSRATKRKGRRKSTLRRRNGISKNSSKY